MKQTLALLALVTLYACAHRHTTSTKSVAPTTQDTAVRDGSSMQKAIIIQEITETPGVAAEYKWIKANYPGYGTQKQSLTISNKVPYDVLHIKNAEGDEKDIWFDISHYFGKY